LVLGDKKNVKNTENLAKKITRIISEKAVLNPRIIKSVKVHFIGQIA